MTTIPKQFLRINGNGHAFLRHVGCNCDRCTTLSYNLEEPSGELEEFRGWLDPPGRAHTSASILFADEENASQVGHHILVDAGAGLSNSLVASRIRGLENLDAILNTHAEHVDHVAGQNALFEGMQCTALSSENNDILPIPYHTTLASYDWVLGEGGQNYEMTHFVQFCEVESGAPFVLERNTEVTVTPIHVAHGWCSGAVIYMLEFYGKKAICLWDIDSPEAERPDGRTNKEIIEEYAGLLQEADVLILDTNTWKAEGTGHTSFQQGEWYIITLRPKVTYCIHFSGHEDHSEDTGYGWTDARLEEELANESDRLGCEVKLARQGQIIEL